MSQRYNVPIVRPSSSSPSQPQAQQTHDAIAPSPVATDAAAVAGLPKVVRPGVKAPSRSPDDSESSQSSATTVSRTDQHDESSAAAVNPNGAQDVDVAMARMSVQPTPAPANGSPLQAAAAAAAAPHHAEGVAPAVAAVRATSAPGPAPAGPPVCGVGIRFSETTSGEFKITQLVPESPAAGCPALAVGDVIVKVDGTALQGKTVQEVIGMIVGPQGSEVKITVLSQCGYPHVMTAPFQALPFDLKKDKKKKKAHASDGTFLGQFHDSNLYGGGTLPPGFEHLESLRSAKPYTNPSLSIRTVALIRQVFPTVPDGASPGPAAAGGGGSGSESPVAMGGRPPSVGRGAGVHPAGRIVGL